MNENKNIAQPAGAPTDHNSQNPACSCPSGNGSLRWPCPVHGVSAQPAGAGAPSDTQYQDILRPVLSRHGMQRFLNGDEIALDPSDYRAIINRAIEFARQGAAPAQAEPVAEFVACGVSVGGARFQMLKPIALGTKLYATAPAHAGVAQADEPMIRAVCLNARAVIRRWDSPLWRQEVGTAEFVNQLRQSLDAVEAVVITSRAAIQASSNTGSEG